MSRVYDTPRYEDQTLNKVLLHLDVATNQSGYPVNKALFGNPRASFKNVDYVKYELQQLDLLTADETMCMGEDEIDDADLYLNYCLGDATSRQGVEQQMKTISTGKILQEILFTLNMKNKTIWCDYDATIRIMHGYLTSKYKPSLSDKDLKLYMYSDAVSLDICTMSMAACRMGQRIIDIMSSKITPCTRGSVEWQHMFMWNRGMELLRLKSMTPEIVSSHEDLRNGSSLIDCTNFSANGTKAARTLGVENLYRLMGMYILEYHDAFYILDYSSLDQLHMVSKMWEGFYRYANNYRICGMGASPLEIAYKNELVTQLFPFRVRDKLSRIIKKGSGLAVAHLINLSIQETDMEVARSNAFLLAQECRSRFYEKNSIEISNYTLPDYGTCLARQHPGTNPGIIVKSKWPKHSCEEDKKYTRNMYDGIPTKEKSRTPKSKSAYTFTGERFRYMTPVQRCVCKAAVVSAYLSMHGANGQFFWNLVMSMWGAQKYVVPPLVTTQVKPGTSTKRLSSSKSHLTHSIAPFKNVQDCIEIIADPIGKFLSAKTVHLDYMSIITAARFVGLMNLAISNSDQSLDDLYFGFLEGSIPPTEEDKLTVFAGDDANILFAEIVKTTDESLFKHVLESMVDVQYSRDDDEEYVCIGFKQEHMGTLRAGKDICISAGYLSNIINCGVVAQTAVRKKTSMVRLAGDEVISRPSAKADTRYRQLIKTVPRSQALVCLAMETVRDLCPGGLKMNIAQAPWGQVPLEFEAAFPNWGMYWTNIIGLLTKYAMSLDHNVCRALVGNQPHHIVNHFEKLDSRVTDSSRLVLSYLYLASYGRLRTPESYTLVSALGIEHISRMWKLASLLRLNPVAKHKVRENANRTLMGEVYRGLYLATQNYYNKTQVMRSIGTSISSYLHRIHGKQFLDIPDIDSRASDQDPTGNSYWCHYRDSLLRYTKEVGLDADYLRKELDNLAKDIFVLGETKALESIEQVELFHPVLEKVPVAVLPALVTMEVEEPEAEAAMPKSSEPSHEKLLNSTVAYLEQGITFATLVYLGEEEFERTYDPDEEEIDEFLRELKDTEEQVGEGQMPDEAF